MNHEIAVGSDTVWKRTLFTQGVSPAWIHLTGWNSEDFELITEGEGDYEVLVTSGPPEMDRTYRVGDADLLGKTFAPYGILAIETYVNAIYCRTGLEVFTEVWVWVNPRKSGVAVGVQFTQAAG